MVSRGRMRCNFRVRLHTEVEEASADVAFTVLLIGVFVVVVVTFVKYPVISPAQLSKTSATYEHCLLKGFFVVVVEERRRD